MFLPEVVFVQVVATAAGRAIGTMSQRTPADIPFAHLHMDDVRNSYLYFSARTICISCSIWYIPETIKYDVFARIAHIPLIYASESGSTANARDSLFVSQVLNSKYL